MSYEILRCKGIQGWITKKMKWGKKPSVNGLVGLESQVPFLLKIMHILVVERPILILFRAT